jgi:hypothetical protein
MENPTYLDDNVQGWIPEKWEPCLPTLVDLRTDVTVVDGADGLHTLL